MSNQWTSAIHHEETLEIAADTRSPDPHQGTFSKNVLGFWLYLMTDCLLFASLFSTYAILHNRRFGGPGPADIFSLPLAFSETMILLLSSLTCGLAILSSLKQKKKEVILWLGLSFLLGASFVGMELNEFNQLLDEGFNWRVSAFLSSYFTLVGTHGLHVVIGLLWMSVIIAQLIWQGIHVDTFRRLIIFSLFWHFLDVVWIFIFTFVYLMGVI